MEILRVLLRGLVGIALLRLTSDFYNWLCPDIDKWLRLGAILTTTLVVLAAKEVLR